MSASAARLQPGQQLSTGAGRTATVRVWRGEGSYARVYRCELGGRDAALKLAKLEIPEAGGRLEREGEVLGALRSPRIVGLLDRGTLGATPFLVLEWLDGETLLDHVASRRRLALRQTLEILEPVCEGVAHLHERGLLHGDLRPQNVLVVSGRGAVLTDPGAEESADAAGDVRACGALLHYALTGETPAPGAARISPAAGYSRPIVHLWEVTQQPQPPSASELLDAVRRLRKSL